VGDNTVVKVDGLINNYKDGFSKVRPMNLSDPEFFSDLFQREVID
jgi:hypothetical protein